MGIENESRDCGFSIQLLGNKHNHPTSRKKFRSFMCEIESLNSINSSNCVFKIKKNE